MRAIHENSKQWAWTSNNNQGPSAAPAPTEQEAQVEYDPLFAVRWGAADHTHALEFIDTLKASEYQGWVQKLARAALLGAVNEYQGIGTVPGWGTPEKRVIVARQAAWWLFQEESDRPFSALWCCDCLGLELGYFRRRLKAAGQPGLAAGHNRRKKRDCYGGNSNMRVQTEMRG